MGSPIRRLVKRPNADALLTLWRPMRTPNEEVTRSKPLPASRRTERLTPLMMNVVIYAYRRVRCQDVVSFPMTCFGYLQDFTYEFRNLGKGYNSGNAPDSAIESGFAIDSLDLIFTDLPGSSSARVVLEPELSGEP
jgi:hypothetical protein